LVPQSLANSRRLRCKVLYDPEWIEASSSMVVGMHGETSERAMESIASNNVIRRIQHIHGSCSFSFANYHGDCRSVEALSTLASDETFLRYHGSGWCTSGLLTVSMGLLLVAFVSPSENRNGRFTASLGWMEGTICV